MQTMALGLLSSSGIGQAQSSKKYGVWLVLFVWVVLMHAGLVWLFLHAKTEEPTPIVPAQPLPMVAWMELAPQPVVEPSVVVNVVPETVKVEPLNPVVLEEDVLADTPPKKQKPVKPKLVEPKSAEPKPTPVKKVMDAKPVPLPAADAPASAAQTPISAPITAPSQAFAAPQASVSEPVEPLVEAQAHYLSNPLPTYSRLAKKLGEQGTVLIKVQVSALGEAQNVQLEKSSGFNRLDESALKTVAQWRFKPATKGDVAIQSWVVVPVKFVLN